MKQPKNRTSRLLDTGAIAAMFASAFFLAAAWLLAGEVLSAFCLGVSFAMLSASVLLLSYAQHVRIQLHRRGNDDWSTVKVNQTG